MAGHRGLNPCEPGSTLVSKGIDGVRYSIKGISLHQGSGLHPGKFTFDTPLFLPAQIPFTHTSEICQYNLYCKYVIDYHKLTLPRY